MHTKLLLEYLKRRDHLGNLGLDESIILTWIQKKLDIVIMWTGFIWLKIGWNHVSTIINLQVP
jgi:hypothetical protein